MSVCKYAPRFWKNHASSCRIVRISSEQIFRLRLLPRGASQAGLRLEQERMAPTTGSPCITLSMPPVVSTAATTTPFHSMCVTMAPSRVRSCENFSSKSRQALALTASLMHPMQPTRQPGIRSTLTTLQSFCLGLQNNYINYRYQFRMKCSSDFKMISWSLNLVIYFFGLHHQMIRQYVLPSFARTCLGWWVMASRQMNS